MSALSIRRLALLLLVVVVAVLSVEGAKRNKYTQCRPQTFWQPQIMVDEKLSPHPKVAVVWDVQPDGADKRGCLTRSKTPVTITWIAKNPKFDLKVVFVPQPECPIPQPECKGSHCSATVPPFKTEHAEPYRCTYEMHNLSKVAQIDDGGDIIVIPCCM